MYYRSRRGKRKAHVSRYIYTRSFCCRLIILVRATVLWKEESSYFGAQLSAAVAVGCRSRWCFLSRFYATPRVWIALKESGAEMKPLLCGCSSSGGGGGGEETEWHQCWGNIFPGALSYYRYLLSWDYYTFSVINITICAKWFIYMYYILRSIYYFDVPESGVVRCHIYILSESSLYSFYLKSSVLLYITIITRARWE